MDLINHIPDKQQFNFPQNIYKKIDKLNEEQKKVLETIKNFIEKNSWKWRIDNNFRFNLPPTIFQNERIIDIPNDLRHSSDETGYRIRTIVGTKFTPYILKSIWETGQFEIESRQQDLPYTWKLSNLIIKGKKNIILRYLKDMAISFYFIYTLKNRFDTKHYYLEFPNSFSSSIYHVYLTGFNLLNLFVGLPMYLDNSYLLEREIKHDDLIKFTILNPNFNFKMYDKETKNNLLKIDDDFKNKWYFEILPSKLKEYKRQKLHKSQITLNINNDEREEFLKFLINYQELEILKQKYQSLEEFLLSQQIIINEKFKINEETDLKTKDYKEQLKKHTIKNLCSTWRNEKMSEFSNNLMKKQEKELTKIIIDKIQDKKDPSLIFLFNTNSKKQLDKKLEEIKKVKKEALFDFRVTRLEIKPYTVYQRERNGGIYYYINKEVYYYVKSDFICWRVWLFLIKLFCTFFNFILVIYRQMIYSMLGIKALFLTELYTDLSVNSNTGELYQSDETITFPRSICNLITWIKDSRNDFENSPDTGILGKGVSRIFNLILNYVIKLIILGGLLISIYPLLIIANVIICFCLILGSPIICPFLNLLDYFICCVFYNRYDKLAIFPLIKILLFDFIICTLFQFIFCSFCLIIQPILSLFFLIYAHIHYLLRYIYDFFFYYILKYLGKIPLTDTCIAWRISGPHLFRERYYDISNRDLMSLVIAEIEKMVMNNYSKTMENIINSPNDSLEQINKVFDIVNANIHMNTQVLESINFYQTLLENQIRQAKKYPILSSSVNVRFSEERLDNVKNLIEAYLRDYTSRNDLSFELDKYEDRKIEQLTEKILINIFGENILQTLDDVDKIVHLESVFNSGLDEISTRIFEDPRFDDKVFVEKKSEKEKIVKLPKVAYFKDVFDYDNPLYLNLEILTKKELDKLLKKNN